MIIKLLKSIFPKKNDFAPTVSKKQIENGVVDTMTKYKKTLKLLEDYDKGKISEKDYLVKSRNLKSFLRSL